MDTPTRDSLSLADFYRLMEQVAALRRRLTVTLLAEADPDPADIRMMETVLDDLVHLPREDGRYLVTLGAEAGTLGLDLDYELAELAKDLIFLRDGEDALVTHLAETTPDFTQEVENLAAVLGEDGFNCFFTDRDGTVNNYCGRYRSSIQSVYNAVFLIRFASRRCRSAVMLTSAPLAAEGRGGGLVDVNVMPAGHYILAGSKGREFLDCRGGRGAYPVEPDKQAVLSALNIRLQEMLAAPERSIFGLIGSGLQFKFGQTTLARQDVAGSISEQRSLALLEEVRAVMAELDPRGEILRIEDTGLDIEIMLTVGSGDGIKDFDKGDAVEFLDNTLELDMAAAKKEAPNLVCGDTASDLPMLEAVLRRSGSAGEAACKAVFVSTREELRQRVRAVLPPAALVSTPDVLVSCLGVFS
jgi:hypothetical protein